MSICRGAAMLGLDLRYAPDSEFLMIAYAGVFLLKVCRPHSWHVCHMLICL